MLVSVVLCCLLVGLWGQDADECCVIVVLCCVVYL